MKALMHYKYTLFLVGAKLARNYRNLGADAGAGEEIPAMICLAGVTS